MWDEKDEAKEKNENECKETSVSGGKTYTTKDAGHGGRAKTLHSRLILFPVATTFHNKV